MPTPVPIFFGIKNNAIDYVEIQSLILKSTHFDNSYIKTPIKGMIGFR
jgi:hypothetical protein